MGTGPLLIQKMKWLSEWDIKVQPALKIRDTRVLYWGLVMLLERYGQYELIELVLGSLLEYSAACIVSLLFITDTLRS